MEVHLVVSYYANLSRCTIHTMSVLIYSLFATQQRKVVLGLLHTPEWTPINDWYVRSRGRYPHNTQQTQETNLNALNGIRTRDPSNRWTAELRFTPHS